MKLMELACVQDLIASRAQLRTMSFILLTYLLLLKLYSTVLALQLTQRLNLIQWIWGVLRLRYIHYRIDCLFYLSQWTNYLLQLKLLTREFSVKVKLTSKYLMNYGRFQTQININKIHLE